MGSLLTLTYGRQRLDRLAFGRIPAYRRYELFFERYRAAAEFLAPRPAALGAFPGGRARSVLDIGCGEGFLKRFVDAADIEWHGTEVNPRRAELCAALGYTMGEADPTAQRLGYPDARFDAVAACHVLEHLDDPVRVLAEIDRVLRPGGLLFIAVPIKVAPLHALLNLYYRAKLGMVRGETTQAYSLGTFRELLARALIQSEKGTRYRIVDLRGLRLISGRKRATWEDHEGFYRFNVAWGRRFPALTPEVNVILEKRA
jgi:SAM-dependent methyltransferase